jgi:hypothetical protein
MHNLFLRLIKEHFSGILSIELARDTEEIALNITFSNPPGDMRQKALKSSQSD